MPDTLKSFTQGGGSPSTCVMLAQADNPDRKGDQVGARVHGSTAGKPHANACALSDVARVLTTFPAAGTRATGVCGFDSSGRAHMVKCARTTRSRTIRTFAAPSSEASSACTFTRSCCTWVLLFLRPILRSFPPRGDELRMAKGALRYARIVVVNRAGSENDIRLTGAIHTSPLHRSIHFAFDFTLFGRRPLVVELLAARQSQLYLGAAVLEVQP